MSDVTTPRAAVACRCRFSNVGAHHDRLLRAATDVAMALDLVEIALNWEELDYSGEALIPPGDWLDFAAEHTWDDPDLVVRLLSAAREVALRRPALGVFDLVTTAASHS